MKIRTTINHSLLIVGFLLTGLLVNVNGLHASGGEFFIKEKVEHVVAASYSFITPVGNFANSGRGGDRFAKLGHGFELEYMYYLNLDGDDDLKIGVGASIPFYFMPINAPSLNAKLNNAFTLDAFGNTTYTPSRHEEWFSIGLAGEVSAIYTIERFSVEGTLKFGRMMIFPPRYKIQNGSYVPPNYCQYFPDEGSKGISTMAYYFNTGVQLNYFFSDHVGIFGGASFNYMQPKFKKDLLYVEMVNNEPTIQRHQISVIQPMNFFTFRLGIMVHVPY